MFDLNQTLTNQELELIGINSRYRDTTREVLGWDEYFMGIAKLVAQRSRDSNTQHGCVIVRDKVILATGYNSFPAGADDINLPNNRLDGKKYNFINHAEESMIFSAAKLGIKIDGATLYCTGMPCFACIRKLVSVGIFDWVVGPVTHTSTEEQQLISKYWIDWYKIRIRYMQ